MALRDSLARPVHDLLSAFGLLTRLPVPQTPHHRPESAWCWPLIGLTLGLLSLAPALLLTGIGISSGIAAVVFMMGGLVLTGALHEDGLADSADGLFGGATAERRLEIMKDSRIGSYGTLALISVLLGIHASLYDLLEAGKWPAILAAVTLSRAPMAVLMAWLPNARTGGLSSAIGRPGTRAAAIAVILALGIGAILTMDLLLMARMVLGAALVTGLVGLVALRRIGGQTGDILGATQQLSLLGALIGAQI